MIQGTAKQLQEMGLKINGVPVDSVALSILCKYKIIRVGGFEERAPGQKGREATVYAIKPNAHVRVS